MPTALKTLRRRPSHSGHTVSESSLNDCTASKRWSHSVHAYAYVGTMVLLLLRWVVRRPGHAGAGVSTLRAATASPKDKRSAAPSVPTPTPRATPAHIRGSGPVGEAAAPAHRVQSPL